MASSQQHAPSARNNGSKPKHKSFRPTVEDVVSDRITPIAQAYWAPGPGKRKPYDAKVIQDLYRDELTKFEMMRVAILEFSQYFENYLWKYFDAKKATTEHVMSIILLVNEKFRDTSLEVWESFHSRSDVVPSFFDRVFTLPEQRPDMTMKERTAYVLFLTHCFQTLEDPVVRKACLRLVHLPVWRSLSSTRLNRLLTDFPELQPRMKGLQAQWKKNKSLLALESTFIPSQIDFFLSTLESLDDEKHPDEGTVSFCERFLELFIDLMAQLQTRRFLGPVLEDKQLVVKCQLSYLGSEQCSEGKLFRQMLDRLKFYVGFEIDDKLGVALSDNDMISSHYSRLAKLQRVAFKHFKDQLLPLAMSNISNIDKREALTEYFAALNESQLFDLCKQLKLIPRNSKTSQYNRKLLTEILLIGHERRVSQRQAVSALPLYPDEVLLWDENMVPSQRYQGDTCLALPKLNLQFLTLYDYLLRNFQLFRLESTYEIREDIAKAVKLLRPRIAQAADKTVFTGYSRFAIPIKQFSVTKVKKPNIGELKPALVKAEITVDLSPFSGNRVRNEWENIREFDVLFLLSIRATKAMDKPDEHAKSWEQFDRKSLGVEYVRGCEVRRVLDETKTVVGEYDDKGNKKEPVGNIRTYTVELDAAQYQLDMQRMIDTNAEDPYQTFNLLMRRKPAENNFKAILKTIRNLMLNDCFVPEWLRDVFLGYGDPVSCQYYKMPTELKTISFNDTFLDKAHLLASFPGYKITLKQSEAMKALGSLDYKPPFRLHLPTGMTPDFEKLAVAGGIVPGQQSSPKAKRKRSSATTASQPQAKGKKTNKKKKQKTKKVKKMVTVKVKKTVQRPKAKSSSSSSSAPSLTEKQISKMLVRHLKDELSKRGLSTSGRKAALAQRLSEAVANESTGSGDADGDQEMEEVEIEEEVQKEVVEEVPVDDDDDDEEEQADDSGAVAMDTSAVSGALPEIVAIPYTLPAQGPYASHVPKRNPIRFTPTQVEAIRSGINPGLTQIVGPPGTGKTDVAVQIMAELYHNFPNQRTLLVTHSNHALNDLFEKIMQRDIDERYLLRLGHAAEGIRTDKDFSKWGRVNHMLERRLRLLKDVSALAESMGMPDDMAYTCETAKHFRLQHIIASWELFQAEVIEFRETGKVENLKPVPWHRQDAPAPARPAASSSNMEVEEEEEEEEEEKKKREEEEKKAAEAAAAAAAASKDDVSALCKFIRARYPFRNYYEAAGQTIFSGNDPKADMQVARDGFRGIEHMFDQLEEVQPFEMLRTYRDRSNYLLTKHAKVIAMTCTHAAIKRDDMAKLRFQFDNMIMEEAAQILEIETFVPMMMQNQDEEAGDRLKRVILLGDHHQLPPVIKNMAFQKYSKMDQSMFTRFVRLGMPSIQLNMQGRMRPSLASLWNWRYKRLGNLTNVLALPEHKDNPEFDQRFARANGGFLYDFQFIDVPDYNGYGETCPVPYFYQNLGEAEYVVQLYMYMRLLGYAADSISIITTYNGQRSLIEDVIEQRCRYNPIYGPPRDISTVDKFQGQQNDYILLSMVRTRTPGHIRDVRRLVVAMSRARFGLFVFGRQSLYQNCLELTNTFNVLLKRPTKLTLVPEEESYWTDRQLGDEAKTIEIATVGQMSQMVINQEEKVRAELTRYEQQVQEYEQAQRDAEERAARERKRQEEMAEATKVERKMQQELKDQQKAEEEAEKVLKAVEKVVTGDANADDAAGGGDSSMDTTT